MKKIIIGMICLMLLSITSVLPAIGNINESKENNIQGSFENEICFFFARIIGGTLDTDRFHLPGGTNVPLVYDHLTWKNGQGTCISVGALGSYNVKGTMSGKTDFTIGFVLPTILKPGYYLICFTIHMEVQWS